MKAAFVLLITLALCFGQDPIQYPLPGYTLIDPLTLVDDQSLVDIRDYGVAKVIKALVAQSYISDALYIVTDYNSISYLNTTNKTYFAFDVQLDNFVDLVIDTTFVVGSRIEDGKLNLVTYAANITRSVFTEFEAIPASEIATSSLLRGLGQYGLNQVAAPVADQLNVSPNFVVNQTNNVLRHVLEDYTILFEFNVTAINEDNDVLYTIYVVSYNPTSGENALTQSTFVLLQDGQSSDSNDTNLAGNVYTQVSQQEFNETTIIQNALIYGNQEVLNRAQDDENIPDLSQTDFTLTTVNSLYVATSETRTDYRFDVLLTNNVISTAYTSSVIYAIYLVNYYPGTDTYNLDAYGYTIRTTNSASQ